MVIEKFSFNLKIPGSAVRLTGENVPSKLRTNEKKNIYIYIPFIKDEFLIDYNSIFFFWSSYIQITIAHVNYLLQMKSILISTKTKTSGN